MKIHALRILLGSILFSLAFLFSDGNDNQLLPQLGAPTAAQDQCAPTTFARVEGRGIGRRNARALQQWCEQAAQRDQPASSRSASGSLAAAGGTSEVWCPPFSTKCYCWNGNHYNGCQNFAAHCTTGLSCGPGGKVCHCTAN